MGFFEDYFLRPVLEHTGYNPINTAAYALLLIVALFLVYKILAKIEIRPLSPNKPILKKRQPEVNSWL